MVRRISTPRPAGNTTTRAVLGKLGMHSNLTSAMVSYVHFEPTIGIAAGRIDKLGMDIRSFKEPLHRAVRDVMVKSILKNFDEGGRPAWEPLAEATWEIRSRWGFGGADILVWTGELRKGASRQNIWSIDSKSAVIADLPQNIWYGKIHQGGYGGRMMKDAIKKYGKNALQNILDKQYAISVGSGESMSKGTATIPARPFLVIQPEDEDAITEIFINWLDERVDHSMWGHATGRFG